MPDNFLYEGSYWKRGFFGRDYRFLLDGESERNLDARTAVFYMATLNTPAMTMKMVGAGSQYAWGDRDSSGAYLDGAKSYRLTLSPNVPAKNFWSVVVYDPQTRAELQTGQPYPSKNNQTGELIENADGSIDLYFGPDASEGLESNWTQTVPDKGWFTLLASTDPSNRGSTRRGDPVSSSRCDHASRCPAGGRSECIDACSSTGSFMPPSP